MDSREGLLKGGNSGPAIVQGDPDNSLLIQAVRHTHERLRMPPQGRLTEQQINDLESWVRNGAQWPEHSAPKTYQAERFEITQEDRSFWSFRPLRHPSGSQAGPSLIDNWVRKVLEQEGLRPNPPADKGTLIRRVSLDLIGLPPTPAQVEEFLKDKSPKAFESAVDRLLASPHFGERWGRYWLDVARYAEDDYTGTEVQPYPNAWRYRDWVIQAFNDDMPYDRFVRAQIAADLLRGDNQELLAGLGLFGLGPWYYSIAQPAQARADERHDRVDVVTRGFLGLTVACARCHDHKYDPISMRDYYGLAGVFASVQYEKYPLVDETVVQTYEQQEKRVSNLEKKIDEFLNAQSQQLAEILARQSSAYITAAWKVLGPSKLEIGVAAAESGLDSAVLERWLEYLGQGEHEHPFLQDWLALLKAGTREDQVRSFASDYEGFIRDLREEKEAIDDENRLIIAKASSAKRERMKTKLPNGFISYEDYCPGCEIPTKSMDRDRYVAWRDVFQKPAGSEGRGGVLRLEAKQVERFLKGEWKRHLALLREELEQLRHQLPPPYPYLHGIGDTEQPLDLRLNIRGNPTNLGQEVPRRFLAVLSDGDPETLQTGSGRLELAEAIASHPLAARVMANRIWQHLFGEGIVRTPSNFGTTGAPPSNPELLEYLAWRFVDLEWSMKSLIREMVLSETYQASSGAEAENEAVDPANRLFWRHDRRQLDVEALRDALLFVSGELEARMGGPSAELSAEHKRRTVYAQVGRFQLDETLALFDFPSPSVTSEQRVATNVPLQRLFFLNSDFVLQRARALAERLLSACHSYECRIHEAYRLLYSRTPTKAELHMGLEFLAGRGEDAWHQYAQVLLSANEFLFTD